MNVKIFCSLSIYKYFKEYLNSIIKKIDCELITFWVLEEFQIDNNFKYLFIQSIPSFILINTELVDNKNIYLLNTEQMTKRDFNTNLFNSYPSFINILDYSNANIKYHTKQVCLLPYQINTDEIYNGDKIYDICIMSIGSNYRLNIVEKLKELNVNVDIINAWGAERDEKLFKYKIIINISHNPLYKIFEQLRCNRCILNKMIVISDKKIEEEYVFKDYVIFEEYDSIPEKVVEVFNNYEKVYSEMFKDFDEKIKEIDTKLESYLTIFKN